MVVMYVAHSHNGPAILNHLPSVEAIDQQVTDVDVLCYLLRHTQMFEQRAGTNYETGKSYLQLLENRRQYCASIAEGCQRAPSSGSTKKQNSKQCWVKAFP